jgi:hypothetical protein
MSREPVAVIARHAPPLETIAAAILGGAAAESGTSPLPIVVGDSVRGLAAVASAPVVFLGWQANSEESRREAGRALASLSRGASAPRPVALFELYFPERVEAPGPSLGLGLPVDLSKIAVLGPAERFVGDPALDAETVPLPELARARRWGARTYSRWRSAARSPSPMGRPPPWASWCGAME